MQIFCHNLIQTKLIGAIRNVKPCISLLVYILSTQGRHERQDQQDLAGKQNTAGAVVAHWDFLPKFLSLHYHTSLEGVSREAKKLQELEFVCLVRCFSAKMERHSKNLQKLSKSSEKLLFFRIFSEFVQFWLENSGPNQLDDLKLTILLLLTPMLSLEVE